MYLEKFFLYSEITLPLLVRCRLGESCIFLFARPRRHNDIVMKRLPNCPHGRGHGRMAGQAASAMRRHCRSIWRRALPSLGVALVVCVPSEGCCQTMCPPLRRFSVHPHCAMMAFRSRSIFFMGSVLECGQGGDRLIVPGGGGAACQPHRFDGDGEILPHGLLCVVSLATCPHGLARGEIGCH